MRAKNPGIVLTPRSFFPKLYNHEVKFLNCRLFLTIFAENLLLFAAFR